jgi:1-deoxy-D-xylulose-5-phosphate reductoisomerase
MKRVTVLGSTGSIGQNTLEVIKASGEDFEIQALTAYSNVGLLAEQARQMEAEYAVIGDSSLYQDLKDLLGNSGTEALCGEEGIIAAAGMPADWIMAAIVGMAGLRPIMSAIAQGTTVAIANKEPLVAAGPVVISEVHRQGARIIPVDSEHNAVFQVFEKENRDKIVRIILTASGGPFRTWSSLDMYGATPEMALAHPNWSMGSKVSIDSATMMNKALEIIEAHYLFDMPSSKIEVLIHPESIIHSMVEYSDGSILAQLGAADMRTPIANAYAWPGRVKTPGSRINFEVMQRLTFEQPDHTRFPALGLAYEVLKAGSYACIALNASNEVAVEAFLEGKIGFTDITSVVGDILQKTNSASLNSVDDIISLDAEIRKTTEYLILKKTS